METFTSDNVMSRKRQRSSSPQLVSADDSCDYNGNISQASLEELRNLRNENQKLKEQLQLNQWACEMYKKTYDLMSESAYILRERDLCMIATNPALDKLLGYEQGELENLCVTTINDTSDPVRSKSITKALNETGSYEGHIPSRKKDGTIFWSLLRGKSFDHSQYGRLYTCYRNDLAALKTREKQLEEAAFTAKKKLDWVNMIAHEIRTPIHQVIGMVDLLSVTQLTTEQASMAVTVKECCHHLSGILNDVLDSARLGAEKVQLEVQEFDLWKCVQDVVVACKTSTTKGLDYPVQIGADVPLHVMGDRTRIRQILVNLTCNAEKFTEKGKVEVTVSVTGVSVDKDTNKSTAKVLFQVKDTGVGVPPSKTGMIFDMFSQADSSTTRKFGGFGMGLNIASKLVQLMKGEMGVISENIPGKGSTFYFTLPLEVVPEPSVKEPECLTPVHIIDNVPPRNLKILVVEDNVLNQKVLNMMLIKIGHVATLATSGMEALTYLADPTKRFDIVLMDIMMPVMDGLQTTQELQKLFAPGRAPIVLAITASVSDELKQQCLDVGMADFIAKPATFKKVSSLIAKWSIHLPPPPTAILSNSTPPSPTSSTSTSICHPTKPATPPTVYPTTAKSPTKSPTKLQTTLHNTAITKPPIIPP